ncbi:MAG: hypothetical protein Ct9H300mP32_5230 [Verrucomicrobiota bacterium]|nr:MAG: hypothetical protein Ct9H300mP32_5230 [Verrucomicrobiota bacterium]
MLLIYLLNPGPGFGWLYGGPGIVLIALGPRYFALGWEGMRLVKARSMPICKTSLNPPACPLGAAVAHTCFCRRQGWPWRGRATWSIYFACGTQRRWYSSCRRAARHWRCGCSTCSLGHHAQVNALCLILLLLAVLPWVFWGCVSFF